jgi:hypothetical protein
VYQPPRCHPHLHRPRPDPLAAAATSAVDGLTAAGDTVTGSVAGITDSVSAIPAVAIDSAAQVLPDITAVAGSAGPPK